MSDRTLTHYADILRNDFSAFVHRSFRELRGAETFLPNWHIDLICAKLEAVRRGEIRRLIINIPPRQLKSIIGSVAFPAFVLGHNPETEILCVSYGQDLADELADSCRTLMTSPFYEKVFKTRLSPDRQSIGEFKTTAGGYRRSTSLAGGITGRGADLIIIDDPIKADDAQSGSRRATANASFYNTIYSRLNNKETGAIVIIMQRLHADDLVAHVQQSEHWDVLALPAIAETDEVYEVQTPYGRQHFERRIGTALHPARESLSRLSDLRGSMSEYVFSAQYQQNPQPPHGFIIKNSSLQYYEPHELPATGMIIQSWDTANKIGEENSYSVCTTWRYSDGHFYLLHVFRDRLEFPKLKHKAKELAKDFRAEVVLIEDKASGTQLIQELRFEGTPVCAAPVSSDDKFTRLISQTTKFESGFVHLPKSAPWLDAYMLELTTYPNAKFDDQVDSTVHALAWGTQQQMAPGMGLLQYMKEEHAKFTSAQVPELRKFIRLKVPLGTYFLLDNGQPRTVNASPEGIICVTDEEAMPLLRNGIATRID